MIVNLVLISVVSCHIQMQDPPPRRSKYNPFTSESDKDYSMTAPLLADGSNFPCKKYEAAKPVKSYTAGESISVQLSGTAIHNGGHCQISISYNDQDFVAINTVLNDCMIRTGMLLQAVIPVDAPACERCTLAWSWVNKSGNREFYMNCVDISIQNPSGSQQLKGKRMTVLNLPGYPNAAEGFPSGQDGVDSYNNAQTITIFPSSFNTFTNTPVNAKDTQPSTWGIQPLTQAQLSSAPVSASSNENNATALVSSNTTGLSQSVECRNGDIRCDGSTKWSICSNGQFIQQDVAPGTLCKMENGVATFGYA